MGVEFLDMMHAGGHTPSGAFVKAEESPATAEEAEKLQLQPGTVLLRCNKLCAADKKPAIYCEDMFDATLLNAVPTEKELRVPIFQLLQDNCRLNCYMDVAQLMPVVADARLAEILQIAPGTPLMYIEEVDFDVDGKPILFSRQYFVNDYFRYNIIRKRL
jgi:GntR family transcriptional regulator